MNDTGSQDRLHLVLGEEELLIERAVAQIIAHTRAGAPSAEDVSVNRMRAGDIAVPEMAELLSPSLFSEDRVVVFEAAAEAGKDPAALVLSTAGDLPDGIVLVVLHTGGGRTKAMVSALEKLGARVHPCAKIKSNALGTFVRAEFKAAGVRVSPEVVQAVLDSVGSDLRELAAASSQLVADTDGRLDEAAVRRYYAGKAEVTGFEVADKAVAGDRAGALESLRWAMLSGTAHVLLADALADAVHTIARVGSAGRGDPFKLAGPLGLPPWKIKKAQNELRGWAPESIGAALQVVARLNGEVKGMAADPEYALERAVGAVANLQGRR
ncbi:DNA polymerase III subunit delta [Tomitella biformata]|uniref:DNA polymerase III subunit delta n=1 Tax=Tomitella biformata TaxID=630403 RepID=UPI0004643E1B|nr:DNA polymerase III subunit delta [Tomitella biformata]